LFKAGVYVQIMSLIGQTIQPSKKIRKNQTASLPKTRQKLRVVRHKFNSIFPRIFSRIFHPLFFMRRADSDRSSIGLHGAHRYACPMTYDKSTTAADHQHPAKPKKPRARARPAVRARRVVLDRPLALVGLMGSGKSVMGRRLASLLKIDFADSDQLVTKRAGISIADIFDLAGESKFREMEFNVIQDQLAKPPHVLATGGGAFCEPRTATLLRDGALVVWLQASPETLLKRIGDISSRPLLHSGPPLQILQDLQLRRAQFYEKAHIHLNTDGLSTDKSIAALVAALDTYQAKQ
jgi:shikimate kinase